MPALTKLVDLDDLVGWSRSVPLHESVKTFNDQNGGRSFDWEDLRTDEVRDHLVKLVKDGSNKVTLLHTQVVLVLIHRLLGWVITKKWDDFLGRFSVFPVMTDCYGVGRMYSTPEVVEMLCTLSVTISENPSQHEVAKDWAWVVELILRRNPLGSDALADEKLAAAFVRVAVVVASEPFPNVRETYTPGSGRSYPVNRKTLKMWVVALDSVTKMSPAAVEAFVPVASTVKKIRPLLKGTVNPEGDSDNDHGYKRAGDVESRLMDRLFEDQDAAALASARLKEILGPKVLDQLEAAIEAGKAEAAAECAAWDEKYQEDKDMEEEEERRRAREAAEMEENERRKAREAEARAAAEREAALAAAVPQGLRMARDDPENHRKTIFDCSKYNNHMVPNPGPKGGPRGCTKTDHCNEVIYCAPWLILCPLHSLAMCGYSGIVDLLTSLPCKWIPCSPCDPNAMSPLFLASKDWTKGPCTTCHVCGQAHQWAAGNGNLNTLMVLAKNGADIEQDYFGWNGNAMEIAEKHQHHHIVQWIQEWREVGSPMGDARRYGSPGEAAEPTFDPTAAKNTGGVV